jgi:hypothetical protein
VGGLMAGLPVHPRRLFALDQNFPEPIVDALSPFIEGAELVPVRRIQRELADVDDWELLRELHADQRPWDGLITNDDRMLALPKEMTVLSQTGLTLVVVKGQGHNSIRATGLLLCHLEHICHQMIPGESNVWVLTTHQKKPETAVERLSMLAEKQSVPVAELMKGYWLSQDELRRGDKT